MTRKEARATLTAAFKGLPKADRDRLEYHRQAKTPVLCGDLSAWYLQGKGG